MAKYFLIESSDPFTSVDVPRHYELAARLRRAGNEVTLFLVDNGVLSARKSAESGRLADLGRAGVLVLADELSLRERGVTDAVLSPGVRKASVDAIAEALESGQRAIWA